MIKEEIILEISQQHSVCNFLEELLIFENENADSKREE